LLGDGGRKHNHDNQQTHKFNPKESFLNKTSRSTTQRRLLLKNGEVNISRYVIVVD